MLNFVLKILGIENAINVEKALLISGAMWINCSRTPFFETFDKDDENKQYNVLFVIWDEDNKRYQLSYLPGSNLLTNEQLEELCPVPCDVILPIIRTKAKQVCIWRKDLKVRSGKKMAQSGHAFESHSLGRTTPYEMFSAGWFYERLGTRKIVVCVDNEERLLEYQNLLQDYSIDHTLITDSGFTEFNGVPTITCIGIHPNWDDEIDYITGSLDLF